MFFFLLNSGYFSLTKSFFHIDHSTTIPLLGKLGGLAEVIHVVRVEIVHRFRMKSGFARGEFY